ncbi:MAG: ATP-binding cassette domain-containing protein [Helicobacter sp.]|uniref:ATP-binding cassette domain-containing protein n=1 Tax=Helicobacter sp. 10-6591 TaxID=2004998 RepID=UPI000DCF0246|nr:ATP-binding cassette domain-containing protein [Helicobacter sp. 10-6591]MCI6217954.1 ATP-binding cassette domain-containing protein [Helicobacter sp.]RAX52492.1 hypothetical protein CCY97_07595 [Helicobacter sp. 10-6591]
MAYKQDTKPLLSIQNLTLAISKDFILQDIHLNIYPNKALALVGESGSGKSMLAKLLLNLTPLTNSDSYPKGKIFLNNKDLGDTRDWLSLRGKTIAYIPQEPLNALNPLQKVGRQVLESYLLHNPKPSKVSANTLLREVFAKVSLDFALASRYPHQLSGGERQRALIAMGIINKPQILICDEPTTALDILNQSQILSLLKKLSESCALVVITHDLHIARVLSDYVAVMQQGRIIETQSTQKLFRAPKQSYTKSLLDALDFSEFALEKPHDTQVLSANNLSVVVDRGNFFFKREKVLVSNVSFHLKKGEILGIAGESGSGKSSLAAGILQLMQSRGELKIFGRPMKDFRGYERRLLSQSISVVFQDPFASLNPRMHISEIITEGLEVAIRIKVPKSKDLYTLNPFFRDVLKKTECLDSTGLKAFIQSQMFEIADCVGLDSKLLYRYPHELSGGERQRVAIARALILRPNVLVLDEPTSALDKSIQKQVLRLLLHLRSEFGLSFLFITHDLEILKYCAHRILVLKNGLQVEQNDSKEIFANPQSQYVKELIKAQMSKI